MNLIDLTCSKCGAALTVTDESTSVKCGSCGVSYVFDKCNTLHPAKHCVSLSLDSADTGGNSSGGNSDKYGTITNSAVYNSIIAEADSLLAGMHYASAYAEYERATREEYMDYRGWVGKIKSATHNFTEKGYSYVSGDYDLIGDVRNATGCLTAEHSKKLVKKVYGYILEFEKKTDSEYTASKEALNDEDWADVERKIANLKEEAGKLEARRTVNRAAPVGHAARIAGLLSIAAGIVFLTKSDYYWGKILFSFGIVLFSLFFSFGWYYDDTDGPLLGKRKLYVLPFLAFRLVHTLTDKSRTLIIACSMIVYFVAIEVLYSQFNRSRSKPVTAREAELQKEAQRLEDALNRNRTAYVDLRRVKSRKESLASVYHSENQVWGIW